MGASVRPSTIAGIDGARLTAALHAVGAADGTVASMRAEPLAVEFAFLSDLTRLTLEWMDGSGPASVVVKRPAAVASRRAVATGLGMYRREVGFYRHLAGRASVGLARCYYASLDEETQDFVLILSDLEPARLVDQSAGCSRVEAETAVDALADLHAGFWEDATLAEMDWLGALDEPAFVEAIGSAFDASWPDAQTLFARWLTPDLKAFGDRYCDLLPELARRLSAAPCTLAHGDYRLDNLFFDGVGGKVAACDWQLAAYCRGAWDLAYFLGQSVTPSLRAGLEGPLLDRYTARLHARGVTDYDLPTAVHDYRLATCLCFAYPVVAGAQLMAGSQRGRVLMEAMFERSGQAMAAAGAADLLGY